MPKGDYLSAILRSPRTVFTAKDIMLLWREADSAAARVRLNYYVKKGGLCRLRRGVYAKDKNYNRVELAGRIFTPSYVSLETVLVKEGLVFQYQTGITSAAYLTRTLTIDGQSYIYKKIKNSVLLNPAGVGGLTASKERAFLDMLYLNRDYHFDNLRSLDWVKIDNLLPLYANQRLEGVVKKIRRQTR